MVHLIAGRLTTAVYIYRCESFSSLRRIYVVLFDCLTEVINFSKFKNTKIAFKEDLMISLSDNSWLILLTLLTLHSDI